VITYVSSAIEKVLGYSPDQLIGESFDRFIPPEDLDRARENISNLTGGGTARWSEYRAENSSGEVRWIRVSSLPISEEEHVIGFRGVLTDITAVKQAEEQLERAAQLAERQRLARELHDSVTQTLYGIDLFSNATTQALSAGNTKEAIENAQQIQELSQNALGDMRLLIYELRPQILEEEGLVAALRDRLDLVEARTGFNTNIRVVDERPLDTSIESELYAIANEALNNSLKHSKAKHVTVILEYTVDSVCLQVWDDGIGFDQSDPDLSKGFGLHNMEERASRIGGSFSLDSSAGAGTVVEVEVAA
jgi:PAS domain S-box-containing protein